MQVSVGTYPDPNPMNSTLDSSGFPEALGAVSDGVFGVNATLGSITKENNVDVFENLIYVSPSCLREGGYTYSNSVYISSTTGEFLANGTPVFTTNVVTVQVSCAPYLGCSFCLKLDPTPLPPEPKPATMLFRARPAIPKEVVR